MSLQRRQLSIHQEYILITLCHPESRKLGSLMFDLVEAGVASRFHGSL